jgi:integrase
MALTFVRHGELRGAEWREFDLEARLWTIPAERMKMPTPHIVPLTRQALEIIEQLHRINGHRKHLFLSTKGEDKVMSDGTLNKALNILGYKDRMTVHGFRGVASTELHEMDYKDKHIELQLAHMERNKVAGAYNYAKYLPQRKKMMQAWADRLDELRQSGQILKMANSK